MRPLEPSKIPLHRPIVDGEPSLLRLTKTVSGSSPQRGSNSANSGLIRRVPGILRQNENVVGLRELNWRAEARSRYRTGLSRVEFTGGTGGLAFFPMAGECWRTGVSPQRKPL